MGNKTDLVSRRVVEEMAGRDLAHEHGIAYIETSALKDENIHEVSVMRIRKPWGINITLFSTQAFDMLVETIMMNTRKVKSYIGIHKLRYIFLFFLAHTTV